MILSMGSMAQQVAKSLKASNGVTIGFYEYTPTDYSVDLQKKYPVIIFFHGIGERGNGTTELLRVKKNAIPKYIDRGHKMTFTWNGKTETFLVLSPQLSSSYGSWPSFYGEEMIRYAKNNLRIDTNRIIVTGLSLGGGGTWKYAATSLANAKQVAAIAPVCGTKQSVDFCNIAKANLPVWAFHAENDPTVSVTATTSSIDAINACGAAVKPIKTLWPTGGHAIWDRAFDTAYTWQNPNLFEWMLGQNKSLPVNKQPVANAGADISVSSAITSVTLDAIRSTDSDGSIARYKWKQVSGPVTASIGSPINSTGKTTISGLTSLGEYQFQVTVYDDRVAYSVDTVKVTVTATNLAPIVNAGADTTITSNSINLNGVATDDGILTKYYWSQLSGPSASTFSYYKNPSTTVSGLVEGKYVFRFRAYDAEGLLGYDNITVTVTTAAIAPAPLPNATPVAKAGADQTINLNSVQLDGSLSTDDKGIKTYRWVMLSGPSTASFDNANAVSTNANNLVAGTYKFRLRVWDAEGLIDVDDILVNVLSTKLQATPVPVSYSADQTSLNANQSTLSLYPNPVLSSFVLRSSLLNGQPVSINIYNANGQLVKTERTNNTGSITIQASSLNTGTYYVIISSSGGKSEKISFIKK